MARPCWPRPIVGHCRLRRLWTPGRALELLTVTNHGYYHEPRRADASGLNGGFILEPFGRNTAPAVAIAAHAVQQRFGKDTIMLVLAADHLIQNQAAFNTAASQPSLWPSKTIWSRLALCRPPRKPASAIFNTATLSAPGSKCGVLSKSQIWQPLPVISKAAISSGIRACSALRQVFFLRNCLPCAGHCSWRCCLLGGHAAPKKSGCVGDPC